MYVYKLAYTVTVYSICIFRQCNAMSTVIYWYCTGNKKYTVANSLVHIHSHVCANSVVYYCICNTYRLLYLLQIHE